MPMRTAVPTTRRERATNYGTSDDVVGGGRANLPEISKIEADALSIYVECTKLFVPVALLGTADFRPMVSLDWGHGGSTVSSDFDVTFRQRIPIVASTASLFGWIAALPPYG